MKSYFTTLFLSVATAMIMLIPACDCGESKVLEGTDALYPVEVNDKWGFIDCEGNMVIEPRFYNAGQFSDGLAPACVGDWLEHKWEQVDQR